MDSQTVFLFPGTNGVSGVSKAFSWFLSFRRSCIRSAGKHFSRRAAPRLIVDRQSQDNLLPSQGMRSFSKVWIGRLGSSCAMVSYAASGATKDKAVPKLKNRMQQKTSWQTNSGSRAARTAGHPVVASRQRKDQLGDNDSPDCPADASAAAFPSSFPPHVYLAALVRGCVPRSPQVPPRHHPWRQPSRSSARPSPRRRRARGRPRPRPGRMSPHTHTPTPAASSAIATCPRPFRRCDGRHPIASPKKPQRHPKGQRREKGVPR